MKRLATALCATALAACSAPDDSAARFAAAMQHGVAALEADDPAAAVAAFTAAAAAKSDACQPRIGMTLSRLLELLHQFRSFNSGLYGSFAADPDRLTIAAGGGLVENLFIQPLLLPSERILTQLVDSGTAAGARSCSLDVDLPVKLAFGSFLSMYFRIGTTWSDRETRILTFLGTMLLAADRLLLSHDLEIPPLTAIKIGNTLDRTSFVGFVRNLGIVPDGAPHFLQWNDNESRRRLFTTIPDLLARGLGDFASLGMMAGGFLRSMPAWTQREVFWIRDVDNNHAVSPGDRLVLNIRGKVQVERDVPIRVRPLEFQISAGVRPENVSDAVEFLRFGKSVFAGEVTPGTRLKLERLNGIFTIFGQQRPFEDVLEVDPLAFFRGPLAATWQRRDANDNCTVAEGQELTCTCRQQRQVVNPDTGRAVTVQVEPDVIVSTDRGPQETCLRELLIPGGGRYPDPPAPKPLRAYLPYWYTDPFAGEGHAVLGVEGEKSVNILTTANLPPYVILGDWGHFVFGKITTDSGPLDLSIPADCIAPPAEDKLGLITIPYLALRDPATNGSLFVNLSVLTGGECNDSTEPLYRSWNPADRYSLNKVVAHYANRYGRLIYDVFNFLVQ